MASPYTSITCQSQANKVKVAKFSGKKIDFAEKTTNQGGCSCDDVFGIFASRKNGRPLLFFILFLYLKFRDVSDQLWKTSEKSIIAAALEIDEILFSRRTLERFPFHP